MQQNMGGEMYHVYMECYVENKCEEKFKNSD